LSIFASYFIAMTLVPLYCAKFVSPSHHFADEHVETPQKNILARFDRFFNAHFQAMLDCYERQARKAMKRPGVTTAVIFAGMIVLLAVTFPFLGRAYFPRTDPGQFIIYVHMPSGSRLGVSNDYIASVENVIRGVVKPKDLDV